MNINDVPNQMKKDPKLQVVDVRTQNEFVTGHIRGAKNVPLGQLKVAMSKEKIIKNQPVIVYCLTGSRSHRAAKVLKKAGYEVKDAGGIADYHLTIAK